MNLGIKQSDLGLLINNPGLGVAGVLTEERIVFFHSVSDFHKDLGDESGKERRDADVFVHGLDHPARSDRVGVGGA